MDLDVFDNERAEGRMERREMILECGNDDDDDEMSD